MAMKKILVMATGGTIGCGGEGTVSPQKRVNDALLSRLQSVYSGRAAFFSCRPLSMLSENATLESLSSLTGAVASVPFSDYDGVILTHGTDTMSFSAAVLGMLFDDISRPLVLTGATLPPEHPESDALDNLSAAVRLILTGTLRGVYAVFRDTDGSFPVYRGTDLREADPVQDRFRAFSGRPLGRVTEEGYVGEIPPCGIDRSLPRGEMVFEKRVLALRPYPGLAYGFIDPSPFAAVLIYLYHSGTGCTAGKAESLPAFIRRCAEMDLPVYAASVKPGGTVYAGSDLLWGAGAKPLFGIGFEAAYSKLLIAVNQKAMSVEDYMVRR